MLFCAPKLVWDLLFRPSAQTVHPFICFSVNPSIPPFFHQRIFPCLVCLSVRPPVLLLSTLLSVYPFVRSFVSPFVFPSVCPSIHTFECPFLLPSMRLSICPSVHPVRRSDLPFWPLVRPSVCLCVFPTIHPFILSFVRPSVRLTIYLSTMAPGSWLQKFIITTVKV